MSVAERFTLFDEPQPWSMSSSRSGICWLISRRNHYAQLVDAGPAHFFNDDRQRRLWSAIAVHQRLKRQGPLIPAGGRDDSFFYFHSRELTCIKVTKARRSVNRSLPLPGRVRVSTGQRPSAAWYSCVRHRAPFSGCDVVPV